MYRKRSSVLKNSFALFSASEAGAEYDVFVVFWPCFGPLLDLFWTADRGDNDFFNSLDRFRNSPPANLREGL